MNGLKYLMVVLLLAGAALMLRAHANPDVVPPREPLADVPYRLAGWTGHDVTINRETLDVLGPGEFLSRLYTRPGVVDPIGLFIAYFPVQKTGDTIHSPKHCLPGAGWYFQTSKYVRLRDVRGRLHNVGEYVISDGDQRQFVIYWYLAHGRSVANEYMAKFYLVADAIRMNRTDGSLIRIMVPINPMKGTAVARARAENFAEQLMPLLPRFVPN